MVNKAVVKILTENGLKVTPQRIGILEVVLTLNNHPSVEMINEYLRLNYPAISLTTIYKSLELFAAKGIIKKIYSDNNTVRYDIVTTDHHHLYDFENDRLEDYFDEDLNKLVIEYLKMKVIPGFKAEEVKISLIGKFSENRVETTLPNN
jgi:Fur family peroxide stress response transcriptional regulator